MITVTCFECFRDEAPRRRRLEFVNLVVLFVIKGDFFGDGLGPLVHDHGVRVVYVGHDRQLGARARHHLSRLCTRISLRLRQLWTLAHFYFNF